MTTVLLTLGRLPKGLELARCLHRAGCRVLVAEPFGLHLCKISRAVSRSFRVTSPNEDPAAYASDLTAIIDAEGVDLVVPVSEEVLYVARVAEGYDGKARFVCPPLKTVLALHDKSAFIETAQSLGLAVPETARADTEEARQILASGEAVMKPALGCAGSKLSFHAPQTLPHESALTNDMIVQRRIRGREVSVLSLARDGEVLMSTTYEGLVHSGTVAVAFRR
ncbi:MAG: ATP-grasp domain-containing protein, partial [Pseudomonadota bacterium]